MKRIRRTLVAIALLASLTACSDGPPSHDDPRDGRVTITWSNCLTGACIYDWKICVGPDLEIHVEQKTNTIKGSKECDQR